MAKVVNKQECIDRINARENIEFVRWDGEFKNSQSKAVIRCQIDGYEWSARVVELTRSNPRGCPQCAGKRKLTANECIDRINSRENIEFVRWDEEFKGVVSKVTVRCQIDGYEWSTTTHSLTKRTPSGCPQCSGKRKLTADEYVDQINSRGDIKFVMWDGEFKNNKSKAVVRCQIDGCEWSVRVYMLTRNNPNGCPHCAGARRWTADEYIDRINARENIEFVRWDGEFKNNRSKAIVRCLIDGFEWSPVVASLVSSNPAGCPYCARYGHDEPAPIQPVKIEIPDHIAPAFDLLKF